jgi:hypothetical protein
MNVQRDPDVILASWLEDGPVRLPDATRRAIAVTTRTTHQKRRPIWRPWRFSTMNGATRLVLGAVAVMAVALGGVYLFSAAPQREVGGPPPSPTPLPTATPMPFPTAYGVSLAAGTYALEMPTRAVTAAAAPVRLTFTLSSRWFKNLTPTTIWSATNRQRIGFLTVDNLTVDSCPDVGTGLLDPPLGPTVDDLVNGLPRLSDLTFSAPTDVTVAGFSGKQIEVSAPTQLRCFDPYEALWTGPQGAPVEDGEMAIAANEHARLLILDVGGVRLVIASAYPADASAADLAEMQAILDSVRIERL